MQLKWVKKWQILLQSNLVFLIVALGLAFSFWLMFHTFRYDFGKNEMLIAGKAWSDLQVIYH